MDVTAPPDRGISYLQTKTLRRWLVTTPGRLRLASVVVCLSLLGLLVVIGGALHVRQNAARAISFDTEPLLVDASELYVSLSDADVTAARAFVTGGMEPLSQRQRYLDDLKAATDRQTVLARHQAPSPEAARAIGTVNEQLPLYSGLVERARGDYNQDLPVGAAYMRQASERMRQQILPAVRQLYTAEAQRLNGSYQSGTSAALVGGIVATGLVVIAFLVLTQLFLARRTNRVFNVGLLAATAVVMGMTATASGFLVSEQHRLAAARRQGWDAVVVLSSGRILALRLQADESVALIARGGGDAYVSDFEAVAVRLGGSDGRGGLLGVARQKAQGADSQKRVQDLIASFGKYRSAHETIKRNEASGSFPDALKAATSVEFPLFDRLNIGFREEIAVSQSRFSAHARQARARFGAVEVAIGSAAVVAVVLALLGLQQRIREYP